MMRRLLVVFLTVACIGGGGPALAQVFPRNPDLQNRIPSPLPPPPAAPNGPVTQNSPPGVATLAGNVLDGKPLRYLIGTDTSERGSDDAITAVSYSTTQPVRRGTSIAYCNLFDEHNTGSY